MWTATFVIIFLCLVSNSKSENSTTNIPTKTVDKNLRNSSDLISHGIQNSSDSSEAHQTLKLRNRVPVNDISDANSNVYDLWAKAETDFNLHPGNDSTDDTITWDRVINVLNSGTRSVLETMNPTDSIRRADASDSCKFGLERFFDSLSRWETWSVRMADASGKIAGGALDGTLLSMGSYEECLNVRVNSLDDERKEDFRGQYCLVGYSSPLLSSLYLKNGSYNKQHLEAFGQPPGWIEDFILRSGPYLKDMALTLGTCVPSTCSGEDLRQIIALATEQLGMSITVTGCQIDKPVEWNREFIAALSGLGVIAILCILGTVTDILKRLTSEDEKPIESKYFLMKVLKIFSVVSNIELLFIKKERNAFACLDGLRFLSISWVVLSHNYDMFETWRFLKYRNFLKIGDQFNGFLPLAVLDNAATSLGSFFFISGFLLMYSIWKKLNKNKEKLRFFRFLFHKYWRLTPSLALTIAVFMAVANIGSGPLWSTTFEPVVENCRSGWWKNFLYVSNWWNHDETCLMHTWYVGCLMQLHLIGFLLIHLTFRWPAVGIIVGLVLFLGSTALVALIVIWNSLPLPALFTQRDFDIGLNVARWLRYRPYYYIHSYSIGMVVGFLVLKYKDKKMKKRYQALGWILAAVGGLYAVYGIYGPGNYLEVVTFFYAFHFIAWSASLGWVVYACTAGFGGIVNRFLSWNAFSLLSTISYLVYLLHMVLIYYTYGSLKERINYGHYEIVCLFLSNLVISYFLAFVGHITVEMPFTHLERFIF